MVQRTAPRTTPDKRRERIREDAPGKRGATGILIRRGTDGRPGGRLCRPAQQHSFGLHKERPGLEGRGFESLNTTSGSMRHPVDRMIDMANLKLLPEFCVSPAEGLASCVSIEFQLISGIKLSGH